MQLNVLDDLAEAKALDEKILYPVPSGHDRTCGTKSDFPILCWLDVRHKVLFPEPFIIQGSRPCLPKVCWFQVLKTNPLDKARCCFQSNRKISKCGNTSPVHCQILKCAKVQLFRAGNRPCSSYTSESCTFAPWFSRFLPWMLLC